MNFCSECGTPLDSNDVAKGYCRSGHKLPIMPGPARPTNVVPTMDVTLRPDGKTDVAIRQDRKLPETREERLAAYSTAVKRLTEIFQRFGFFIMNESDFSCTAQKGRFVIDFKTEENTGRIAYVTSNLNFDPTKAGKKESGATIQKGRHLFTSRDLLRVTVSGQQSIPVFLELRQNIPDPELHICRGVMFVLQLALSRDSSLHQAVRNVDFLKDVPKAWLPAPGMAEVYPELQDLIESSKEASSAPASLPRWESEIGSGQASVIDV